MSLFKAPPLCLLCSCRSIELKQFGRSRKGVENNKSFQKTDVGMRCSKCTGFVCVDCLTLLVPIIAKDANHFVSTSLLTRWKDALSLIKLSGKTHSEHIGHCCDVHFHCDDTNTSASSSSCLSPDGHTASEKMIQPMQSSIDVGRLSGCIFFPEFDLFIDSPLECMDIHALGAEYTKSSNRLKRKSGGSQRNEKNCYLEARWHCVVPPDVAASIHDISPLPNVPIPNHWEVSLLHNIKVPVPHSQSDFMVRYLRTLCVSLFNYILYHS